VAKKGDEPGLRDLIAAIVKISDTLDRLTFLVEEVAMRGLDLPIRDDVIEEADEEQG
jgi:hypothetical protein